MSIRINEIEKGSPADKAGLLPGENIISLNGKKITDFLDLQFYCADEVLEFEIKRLNGNIEKVVIDLRWEDSVGIYPEDHKCRECINNCIFCFVDQMPADLRRTLYIKDDDYPFSFIFGNFITMTNLSKRDYRKIFEQRLSPLYISVHTTNPVLHKQMLRYKKDFNIMKQLEYLKKNEIEFHTQIVVVPGWNDGKELTSTLNDLDKLGENCLSIGIVPVGLTRFREKLPDLRTITKFEAKTILKESNCYSRCWCSDEIYLMAGKKIPKVEFYDEFAQLENGIGMIRMLLENWQINKKEFFSDLEDNSGRFVFICGELVAPVIKKIIDEINIKIENKARLQIVYNKYFGESVTVSGLLTWKDIKDQIEINENETAVFCSNTFNAEEYTLDGKHESEIAAELGGEILIVNEEFFDWRFVKNR